MKKNTDNNTDLFGRGVKPMDLVNNETVRRLVYKYDNKTQKDIHMEQMRKDGWHVARNPYAFFDTDNPLRVTYEKTTNNLYEVARL